ncbi:Ankyrin_repeat-containing protein [Hexamita inflata]|uniref:Ankyrin repeat-containing protein n=1 Tax=Hexamita inflata TaxID=28002 RepID=A0AA86TU46_9EUKA|nr:Ankyrin repeat-containing protein [Hexamita inflata]
MLNTFFQAIQHNDIEFVTQNIGKFKDMQDNQGNTGLMVAAYMGRTDIVEILKSSQIQKQNKNGFTALMSAASTGNDQIVKILLDEVNLRASNGTTALMCAAQIGSVKCCQQLQKEIGLKNLNGVTALHLAMAQGHHCLINILIDELEIQDIEQRTCLMIAAINNQFKCIDELIKHQCLITKQDIHKKTALRYVFDSIDIIKDIIDEGVRKEKLEAIKSIIKCLLPLEYELMADDMVSTLMLFCYNRMPVPKKLVETQSKQKQEEGITALMLAAQSGNISAVQQLKEFEINMQDKRGRTATMFAASQGQLDCFKLTYNDEFGLRDINGAGVLHYAAQGGNVQIMNLLTKFKGQTDCYGNSALMFAINAKQLNTVDYLAATEADIVNNDKLTPLMCCAKNDFLGGCQYFEGQGGQVDVNGYTAVQWAAMCDSTECFLPLLELENLKNNRHLMFQAVEKNSYKVLKLIIDCARRDFSPLVDYNFTALQRGLCSKLTQITSKKYNQLQDGLDPLDAAVLYNASECVEVLAPFYRFKTEKPFTPLMFAVQNESLSIQAIKTLVGYFGGIGLRKNVNGFKVGTTALMIAKKNGARKEVIDVLEDYERDCVDADGKKASDM